MRTNFKNAATLPYSIISETQVIEYYSEWEQYGFVLDHVPVYGQEFTVTGYTIITSGSPTAGQLLVTYVDDKKTAFVQANSADDGKTVSGISYTGQGSSFHAKLLKQMAIEINTLRSDVNALLSGSTVNTAPTFTAQPSIISATSDSFTTEFNVNDSQNDPLTFNIYIDGGIAQTFIPTDLGGGNYRLVYSPITNGNHTFVIGVSDGVNAETVSNSTSVTISIPSLWSVDASTKALYKFDEPNGTTVVNSANAGMGDLTLTGTNYSKIATSYGNALQVVDDWASTLPTNVSDTSQFTINGLANTIGVAVGDRIIISNAITPSSATNSNYFSYIVQSVTSTSITLNSATCGTWVAGSEIYKATGRANTGSFNFSQFNIGTGDFTVETMVKLDKSNRNQWIIGIDTAGMESNGYRTLLNITVRPNNGVSVLCLRQDNTQTTIADNGIDLINGTWSNGKSNPVIIADGNWHKIKFVRSSINKQSILYVDDVLCNTTNWSGKYSGAIIDMNNATNFLMVGGTYYNNAGTYTYQGYTFNGSIDEVRISNIARQV